MVTSLEGLSTQASTPNAVQHPQTPEKLRSHFRRELADTLSTVAEHIGQFDHSHWVGAANDLEEDLVALALQRIADRFKNGSTKSKIAAHWIGQKRREQPFRERRREIRGSSAMPFPILCSATRHTPRSDSHLGADIDRVNQPGQQVGIV